MTTEKETCETRFFDTGDVIDDKWILIEQIGEGGMGVVYRAHQLNLKRDVAIKVISADMLANLEDNPEERNASMARFKREVQTMAQVRHPNVLQIYDYGSVASPKKEVPPELEYIAMEYVAGNTFRFTMSEQGFGDESGMLTDWLHQAFLPVLDGVAAIHGHGIVHRDIKPENILMDQDVPKITDFGLARALNLRCVSNSWDVKGTWPYMAPEQFAEFRKAGVPADIYALGKILFEAVEGKLGKHVPPFKAAFLTDPATPLLQSLDRVIRKATCEDPVKRHQNVSELKQELLKVLETVGCTAAIASTPVPPRATLRWLWIGIAAAIVSMAGMTVYHVWEGMKKSPVPKVASGVRTDAKDDWRAGADQAEPSPTRLADDGRKMRLLEDAGSGRMIYADTALVTFHHYLEFLNEIVGQVSVIDGVVRQEGTILFYLEDQVLFRNDRFQLLDAARAPLPVTRVTWQGAMAYAHHFSHRLPTFEDWSLFKQQVTKPVQSPPSRPSDPADDVPSHMNMMEAPPAQAPAAKADGSTPVVKEWVGQEADGALTSRVVSWSLDKGSPALLRRYPWEGFADVGFRTVLDVIENSSEEEK